MHVTSSVTRFLMIYAPEAQITRKFPRFRERPSFCRPHFDQMPAYWGWSQLPSHATAVRYAIYTRKKTEEGLEWEFNSLDAQRDAAQDYITSRKAEG